MSTSLRTRDAMPRFASNDRATSMTTSTVKPPADRSHPSPQKSRSRRASQSEFVPEQPPQERTLRTKRSRTSSLFHLFTKPNVERAKGHSEPVPSLPDTFMATDFQERPSTRMSTRSRAGSHITVPRPDSPPPSLPERPPSRRSLRRLSIARLSVPHSPSKSGSARLDAPWDPPPLFQAYPQAIKHISLKVPGPAFDPSNRNSTSGWGNSSTRSRSSIFGMPKSNKPGRKDTQYTGHEGWSKKIYILVTTGHVLEYAGDGAFDRLPEQILRLGKDSAAFASDLIPGHPYVLQVLQTASGGVQVVQLPQKSFLSRLGLQFSSTRRSASNLLLVFAEPEQMDSWMVAIRKEIEMLGGKKCRPISTIERLPDNSDAISISSQRYQNIQRIPSGTSIRAASIKSVPSLSTMPLSPTLPSPNRTDSATFTANDNKWSDPTPVDHSYVDHNPYPPQSKSYVKGIDSLDNFTETTGKVANPTSRSPTPPPRIASQDFSDFYFTDHTPEEISAIHPAYRPSSVSVPLPQKDRRRSAEPSSRRTSDIISQVNTPLESPMQSQWDLPQSSDIRTWQAAEAQATSTTRAYRSWSSNAATPRFSLGPKVYSQSVTSLQSSAGAMKSIVEQARPHAGETIHPTAEEIGLGIESYCSVTTDSTKSASTCSEVSTTTELSALASTRISTSLSPFILQSNLIQSPTLSQQNTPRPYQPRKVLQGSPAPLQIPARTVWQNSPSQGDSRSGATTPSPSLSNVLRRPANLPVHSDPAPFLSSVAKVKGVNHQQRTSVLVPIIRPGTLKSSRKQKLESLIMDLPPQMPPPTSPLPVPPGIAV